MTDDFIVAPVSGNKGYSPDEFYTASTNSKGFGSSLRVKVPPEVMGEIGALIASRCIPQYRTPADFHRDAVVHRLHQLKDILKDDAPLRSVMMERLAEKLAAESYAAMFQDLMDADARIYEQAVALVQSASEYNRPKAILAAQGILAAIDDPGLKERLAERLARYM